MIILCDTSSILLLLRIAPDMFINPTYECATIHDVLREITSTTKFKTRYPWLAFFRAKLNPLLSSEYHTQAYKNVRNTIGILLQSIVINEKTQRVIDLSEEDQAIAACVIANGYRMSSGDSNLIAFLQQEFKPAFKGNLSALEVVNFWLEKGIVVWDDAKNAILADWKAQGEVAQPRSAIKKFTSISGYPYPGS
jgi:hypothetical protein